ncbi:MAG: BTAD domain-containing putative transcriptional regulator [Actinomycetota bacterium]
MAALPELSGDFSSVEGAAAALHGLRKKAVLVLDDLHTLEDSIAEQALGRLVRLLPRNLAVVTASRSSPKFNLSRLRLDGRLRLIEAGDLRFRAWEVERLYNDLYRNPLTPEDLALLTHKTSGWAAGLHLFHLATRGRPLVERRARLETLNGSSKLIREYLADNVVRELPFRLRTFLVETCVLGRLTGRLCDRLLQTTGSAALLEELEDRQLLSTATAGDGYRCHDVLKTHLEAILVQRLGETAAHLRYRQAGILLEDSGDHADALYAFFRAEDWEGVGRLLANEGPRLASSAAPWIDRMPLPLAADNPWLLLGSARRQRLAGRWREAAETYTQAENAFDTRAEMEICRSERRAINIWLERPLEQLSGWDGLVRASTRSPQLPVAGADRLAPRDTAAIGLASLLAGNVNDAREALKAAAEMPGASESLVLGARLAETVALLLHDPQAATELDSLVSEADRCANAWLALMGRAALALTGRPEGLAEAASVRAHFVGQDDIWGRALAGLMEGLGRVVAGKGPGALLEPAAEDFRALGATTLEAWCLCARSLLLVRSGDPTAPAAALQAESVAKAAHLGGPLHLAYEALAIVEPHRAEVYGDLAEEIRVRSGLARPTLPRPAELSGDPVPVDIRCFGEFRIIVGGSQLDLRAIKPRARQLLRLLAIHYPRPVHLEIIGAALWPESDSEVVRRNLQVAVHAVRRLLASGPFPSGATMLARDGESYRLDLPEGSLVDLRELEQSLAEGRQARAAGDSSRAAQAYQRALDLHFGDLLSEDGPAEWVVMERERGRAQAVEAAQLLADACRESGELDDCVRACERGLRLDRFSDNLWRRLISAHQRAGNRAAEMKARLTYSAILAELGLEQEPAI